MGAAGYCQSIPAATSLGAKVHYTIGLINSHIPAEQHNKQRGEPAWAAGLKRLHSEAEATHPLPGLTLSSGENGCSDKQERKGEEYALVLYFFFLSAILSSWQHYCINQKKRKKKPLHEQCGALEVAISQVNLIYN